MTMIQSKKDGKWYGTLPVILTRIVDPTSDDPWREHKITETYIGYKPPYGYVLVNDEFEGERYTEKPVEWWESKGFTVTVDRTMEVLVP